VLGLAVLTAWTAGVALGQTPDPLSNIFQDTQEVHVINVDVVVTDADGQPVTGLTREDFELLEDGRPVTIDNFFAVQDGLPVPLRAEPLQVGSSDDPESRETGESAAVGVPPTPELHLAVFVDNVQIRSSHRNRMLERLRDYLAESWRPGLSVMLATNDRGMAIRQSFTGRREQVLGALEDLKTEGIRGSRLENDLSQLLAAIGAVNVDAGSGLVGTKAGMFGPGRLGNPTTLSEEDQFDIDSQETVTAEVASDAKALIPQIFGYAQQRNDEVLGSLAVLSKLVDTLSGLPGRKAVLHVSDGLSVNPAEALFQTYDEHFEPLARVPGVVGLGNEVGRYDLQAAFTEVADLANTGRVTIYALDASPPEALRRGSADRSSYLRGSRFASTEERNEQEPLRFLAAQTGGRASLSNVTLDSTLSSFFDDSESFYSLGFQTEPDPGRKRELEVRLQRSTEGGARVDRKLTLRHRSAVRDRTVEERMAERTLAALLLGRLHNPLEVRLEALEAEPAEEGSGPGGSPGMYLVPVVVRIPLGKLVLVPGAREHQARVSMYVAVVDDRGRTSEVQRQMCPIRIPNSELLVALGGYAGCGVRLLMRPGEQQVAVSVRDELSARDSTARLELVVGAEQTAREPAPDTSGIPGDRSADVAHSSR